MHISISGEPKEIADLVLALQGQQDMDVVKAALVELPKLWPVYCHGLFAVGLR